MTDLYFHSPIMYQAADSMRQAQGSLQDLAAQDCAPTTHGLIFGPRTPGLEAAATLAERTAEAGSFAALMSEYAASLVTKFQTTAEVFRQLEAGK